jgi:hypothetical protein
MPINAGLLLFSAIICSSISLIIKQHEHPLFFNQNSAFKWVLHDFKIALTVIVVLNGRFVSEFKVFWKMVTALGLDNMLK